MKIDSIDIRSFDAKQLTVDFEPPQTGVTVEMFDGALIPSESETYTPLSGLTVTVLFRGKDRDEVQKHVSDFNAELQFQSTLPSQGATRSADNGRSSISERSNRARGDRKTGATGGRNRAGHRAAGHNRTTGRNRRGRGRGRTGGR